MGIVLKVEHLKKRYGQLEAVKDVSFEVARRRGLRPDRPERGRQDDDPADRRHPADPDRRRRSPSSTTTCKSTPRSSGRRISYLPEEAGAYKNMKGMDYLRLHGRLLRRHPGPGEGIRRPGRGHHRASGDRLNDKVGTYSKGMTRKLLLARALMTKPVLAILDEPTSGLDVLNALEVREIIRRYAKEGHLGPALLPQHARDRVPLRPGGPRSTRAGSSIPGPPASSRSKYQAENLEEVFRSSLR